MRKIKRVIHILVMFCLVAFIALLFSYAVGFIGKDIYNQIQGQPSILTWKPPPEDENIKSIYEIKNELYFMEQRLIELEKSYQEYLDALKKLRERELEDSDLQLLIPQLYNPNETSSLYDIPLSDDLQTFIFNECQKYNLSFPLVLSLIKVESDYDPNIISSTNDYGLMQVNIMNHEWLRNELGIEDFLKPYDNIRAGTFMLGRLFCKYKDPHKALMAYNCGENGARECYWNNEIYQNEYSIKIMNNLEKIKKYRRV